jgi:TPR repeat protein
VKWYRKAADRGYAEAQFNLGIMYEERRAPDLDKEADANVSYALRQSSIQAGVPALRPLL